MTTIKSLIKQLQSIPNTCEVVGFDIRVLNPKTKSAQHLFSLEVKEEEEESPKEENKKIGYV